MVIVWKVWLHELFCCSKGNSWTIWKLFDPQIEAFSILFNCSLATADKLSQTFDTMMNISVRRSITFLPCTHVHPYTLVRLSPKQLNQSSIHAHIQRVWAKLSYIHPVHAIIQIRLLMSTGTTSEILISYLVMYYSQLYVAFWMCVESLRNKSIFF